MAEKQIRVTQVKSVIGRPQTQRRILRSLGLKRRGRSVIHRDTPAIRGMVRKVIHLVEVSPV